VQGEKTALIDCMSEADGAAEKLEAQAAAAGTSLKAIDYLVLNHLEPDHTGYINTIRQINPNIQFIASKKGIALVRDFFGIAGNLREVQTGDTLDLGDGLVLSFIDTPNVHRPETMMTYCPKHGILFSCDGFGSYGATGDRLFDDEFSESELAVYEQEALRYYANIVASFSTAVKFALDKLKELPLKVVAPSHGIVWRTHPERIVNCYTKYAGYNTGGEQDKEICVIWGSMYGNTRAGLDAVLEGIKAEGVPYTEFEFPDGDTSAALAAAFKSRALVIAMPTYEYKMFPPMAYIIGLFGKKHFSDKIVFRLGSWGWIGGAQRDYEAATASFKWTQLPSYEWQGVPKHEDLEKLKERGREIARRIR
jgi:flavorubredoxin